MDAMEVGWSYPQEDEFAFLGLGSESTYWRFVFPSQAAWLVSQIPDLQRPEEWKATVRHWVQALTLRQPKRLVLKSPAYAYRVDLLLDLFPQAKFFWIRRPSAEVCKSMQRMHRILWSENAISQPPEACADEIFEQIHQMDATQRGLRERLATERYYEIDFPSLLRAPYETMVDAYRSFSWDCYPNMQRQILDAMHRSPSRPRDGSTAHNLPNVRSNS